MFLYGGLGITQGNTMYAELRTTTAIWYRAMVTPLQAGEYLVYWVSTVWDKGRAKIKHHSERVYNHEIVSLRYYTS